jgi:hypothetical protein
MNIFSRWIGIFLCIVSFFSLADDLQLSVDQLLDEIAVDLRHEILKGDATAIRFKIANSPIVKAVILWDKEGDVLFPIKNQLSYVSGDLILRDISRFNLLLETANPVTWEKRDASNLILHYCQNNNIEPICIVVDSTELSERFDVSNEKLLDVLLGSPSPTFSLSRNVLFGLLLFIVICFLFHFYKVRTKALLVDTESFTLGDLVVKPKQQIGVRDSLTIALTNRDIKILTLIAQHPSEVLSKDQLYCAGWGREFLPNSRALEQHIMVLRRKLDPDKKRKPLIETVHGHGYRTP